MRRILHIKDGFSKLNNSYITELLLTAYANYKTYK